MFNFLYMREQVIQGYNIVMDRDAGAEMHISTLLNLSITNEWNNAPMDGQMERESLLQSIYWYSLRIHNSYCLL